MKDKDFDHIIRQKLNGLHAPEPAPGWEELEGRLDAHAPAPPSDTEEALFHKLRHFEAPYDPAHWDALAAKLEQIQLPRRMLKTKLVEAMVFLLLLLPFTTRDPAPANTGQRPAQALLEGHSGPQQPPLRSSIEPTRKEMVATSAPSPAARERQLTPFTPLPPREQSKRLQPGSPYLTSPVPTNSPAGRARGQAPSGALHSLLAFPTLPLSNDHGQEYELPDLPVSASATADRRGFFISMYGIFNFNQINTPPQNQLEVPAVRRFQAGYGSGLEVGTRFGRVQLLGRAEYNAYSYQPQQIVFVEGSLIDGVYGGGIEQVSFNALGLGVGMRYRLLQGAHWNFYAGGGLQLNAIFEANYFLADFSAFLSDPSARRLSARGAGQSSAKPAELSEKQNYLGWFEGGTFEENYFLNANLEAGVEVLLSDDWSLFGQAAYRPFLFSARDGLGPDRDRIHSFSLQAGVRINLFR